MEHTLRLPPGVTVNEVGCACGWKLQRNMTWEQADQKWREHEHLRTVPVLPYNGPNTVWAIWTE